MSDTGGYLDTERHVDSIRTGARHRQDLGDIDALAASIRDLGLLQPITISPDGLLVCGRRRLEAVRTLGWKHVKVWVRTGISDGLHLLLAERDENGQRKPLTPTEASALYEEVRALEAAAAARRQEASRFGARPAAGDDGAAPGAAPSDPGDRAWPSSPGDARSQAARLVTGKAGYTNHEIVAKMRHLAEDDTRPLWLRQMVRAELADIDAGSPVRPAYQRVLYAIAADRESREPEAAAGALPRPRLKVVPRVADDDARPADQRSRPAPRPEQAPAKRFRSTAAFTATWADLVDWDAHYDVEQLARDLSDADYEQFLHVREVTDRFADALTAARAKRNSTAQTA